MNRHERRAAAKSKAQCGGTCGTTRQPQIASPHDRIKRCLPCHSAHLQAQMDRLRGGAMPQSGDIQTTHQMIVARELQERMHKTIESLLPGRERTTTDDLLVVQALMVTAGTFAHHAGVDKSAFVEQASRLYDEISLAIAAMMKMAPSAPSPPSG